VFASPAAVVAASRIVLLPAFSCTVTDLVAQAFHAPVLSNGTPACATVPFTLTSAGRPIALPLAYRMSTVALPALGALTVNCAAAPTALLVSQNPPPE
jgi:hypothetical protein